MGARRRGLNNLHRARWQRLADAGQLLELDAIAACVIGAQA